MTAPFAEATTPNPASAPATKVEQLPLKAMRLRAGMALQTKRLVAGAVKREGQFLAAMESKGVMVGPHGTDGEQTELQVGDVCVVRGFTGQYEFSFVSKVLSLFEKPFPYALLAYPKHVDASLVRRSLRTKTSWPTQVWLPVAPAAGAPEKVPASLVDVSPAGAMVKAAITPPAVGGDVHLSVAVEFDGAAIELVLQGTVCHAQAAQDGDGHQIGIAFKGLTQHDKLVLHVLTQSGATPAPAASATTPQS